MAQLAEQLICNQQVIGSSPIVGFVLTKQCTLYDVYGIIKQVKAIIKDGFPSGQRGQTVNLLTTSSKVRILLHPFISFIF